MIRTVIRSNLKNVMAAHNVKAIDLVRAIRSRYEGEAISQPTVYAVAKGNGMPDQRTADQIMHGLQDLIGRPFALGEIFEWQPDAPTPGRDA